MGHAARLFYSGNDETLRNRITPTEDQRAFLQAQWNALADHLRERLSADHGYSISTWIQGSYKYGTLIKPVRLGEEYDVDVGVYFQWSDDQKLKPAPTQLRQWVQQELLAYQDTTPDIKRVEEPPKERCSRTIYNRQFHIDTPIYHLERSKDRRRLALWSNAWENSDPKTLYKWFKEVVNEDDRDQLRRIVRYLKAWAAVGFDGAADSRPSSILLTVLTAQAFESIVSWRLFAGADDDVLTEVISKILDRLEDNRVVSNPVAPDENLNRISDVAWEGFVVRLRALKGVAEHAKAASDEASACLIWSEAFSYLMPLPDTEEIEVEDDSGRALMILPEIEIEVYAKNPKRLLSRHRNNVPAVPKDCELEFRIINPQIVPPFALIEWTVRNTDIEADALGDLGHRRAAVGMLSAKERTAYSGRHYMDCIVRVNGAVYAVRRVPVTVVDLKHPARHSPKPAYTRLRSRLGRR